MNVIDELQLKPLAQSKGFDFTWVSCAQTHTVHLMNKLTQLAVMNGSMVDDHTDKTSLKADTDDWWGREEAS